MISKELLSEVLNSGLGIYDVDISDSRVVLNKLDGYGGYTGHEEIINIHELAHKCKEWAMNNSWYLETFVNSVGAKCTMTTFDRKLSISAKSEPEVIFDACEFILEQGKQDGKM